MQTMNRALERFEHDLREVYYGSLSEQENWEEQDMSEPE
jgi:hypothetical protein